MRNSWVKRVYGRDPLEFVFLRIGTYPIDGWTLAHFLVFAALGWWGTEWIQVFIFALIWEYFQWLCVYPRQQHNVSDMAASVLGFLMGHIARPLAN